MNPFKFTKEKTKKFALTIVKSSAFIRVCFSLFYFMLLLVVALMLAGAR